MNDNYGGLSILKYHGEAFSRNIIEKFDSDTGARLFETMILIRWVIVLFLPLSFFIGSEAIDFRSRHIIYIITGVYAAFNLYLTITRKRGYTFVWLHFVLDTAIISSLIYCGGGIRSDLFLLYYFFLLYATVTYGFIGGALGTLIIFVLYCASCFLGARGADSPHITWEIMKRLVYFLPAVVFAGLILRQNELLNRENEEHESYLEKIGRLIEELTRREEEREEELSLARQVMESLACQEKEYVLGNVTVHVRMRYARRLGGDYYGIIPDCPVKGTLTVFVGDVVGSGTSAALLMVSMMILLQEASMHYYSPREVLTFVNKVMVNTLDPELFNTTVFFLSLDTENNILTYSRAGHESGLLYEQGSSICRELTTKGALLGVIQDVHYFDESLELKPGDKVVLFTDGLVEARKSSGDMWGRERLEEVIVQRGNCSGRELIGHIFDGIDRFSQNEKNEDDQALIVLSIN